MYNRYIPQPDGSFKRNHMQEKQPDRQPDRQPPKPPPIICDTPKEHSCASGNDHPVGGFLRQLLPKSFDTGDLFVVLLLLLMAGDSEEGRSNALLTLALYFIM